VGRGSPRRGLDLRRCERLVAAGDRALQDGHPAEAVDALRDALALWRGPPLADLAYESFAQAPIVRLEELRLAALELRVEAELALGRYGRLVGELQELVRLHPMRERLCCQLMLALLEEAIDLARVVDRDDARMLGRRRQPRLTQEALPKPGVIAHSAGEQLERDVALKSQVLCPVHHPHAAATEHFGEAVLAERRPHFGDPFHGLAIRVG
jgi:hypothetical protein